MEFPIKTIYTVLTFAASVFVGVIFIDERYAHAADYKQQMITLSNQLEVNRLSGEVNVLENRKSTIKDKIIDISRKSPKKNSEDQLYLDQYQSEMNQVDIEIINKKKIIDQLRSGK
jgi:ATP adenylyltransferase/5',5'''-P-1,P-4-tetraphosphate phosphorylase II